MLWLLAMCLVASIAAAQSSDPGRVVVTYSNGLVMLNTDGSNVVNVTENAAEHQAPYPPGVLGSDDWFPSVALDGKVAFQSAHDTLDGTHKTGTRIYVMHPSGVIKQLTTIAGLHIDMGSGMYPDDIRPVISRDGSKICFIGVRHEEEVAAGVFAHPWRDVFVVNTDGTNLHQVTTSQFKAGSGYSSVQACAWNPDGSKIAFKGTRLHTDQDGQERFHTVLATINADGTGETHIPVINDTNWLDSSGAPSEQALDWSPDGQYILVEYGGGAMGSPYARYLILDLAPGGTVTEIPGPLSLSAGSARFSPDSQRIVYETDNPTFTAAYLTFIDRDGANRVVVDTLPLMRYVGLWWMDAPSMLAPASLELSPSPVRIFKGGAPVQVTPTLYDTAGQVIVHGARSWRINPQPPPAPPAVGYAGAVVDSGATAVQTFTLTAANAGLSASTSVIVSPAAPSIALDPGTLDFGNVTIGGSLTNDVIVRNRGSLNLVVSGISLCAGASSEFSWSQSVPFTVAPNADVTVPITYAPSDAGSDAGCLQFASNDAENPSASVVLAGVGTSPPQPAITLLPPSLAFASVDVGTVKTMSTQVQNTGSATLAITGIGRCAGTSTEFSWSPNAPLQIAPGTAVELVVTYAPADVGIDAGCLSITSNDPVNPTRSLALSGTGNPPAQLTDLDIKQFTATKRVSLTKGRPAIAFTLVLSNPGTAAAGGSVELIGVENAIEIYNQTVNVTVPTGKKGTSVGLPAYVPTAAGSITWTLTVVDQNPDGDTVTAMTNVLP